MHKYEQLQADIAARKHGAEDVLQQFWIVVFNMCNHALRFDISFFPFSPWLTLHCISMLTYAISGGGKLEVTNTV